MTCRDGSARLKMADSRRKKSNRYDCFKIESKYFEENKERMIERELVELQREFRKEYGRILNPEETEYQKTGIEMRFKEREQKKK